MGVLGVIRVYLSAGQVPAEIGKVRQLAAGQGDAFDAAEVIVLIGQDDLLGADGRVGQLFEVAAAGELAVDGLGEEWLLARRRPSVAPVRRPDAQP